MGNLWIRAAYSVLLGLVIALTVGFGVTMVFTGPRPPDTPSLTFRQLQSVGDNQQDTDKLIAVVDRFYQDAYDYRRAYPSYQRNVLVTVVLLAVVVGGIGLALGPAFNYLRLGLTLGAILLLVYAVAMALSPIPNPAPTSSGSITNLLASGSPPGLDFAGRFLRFAVSFIALLVFLFMGLWRLTDWAATPGMASRDPATPAAAPGNAPSGPAPQERVAWGRPENQ